MIDTEIHYDLNGDKDDFTLPHDVWKSSSGCAHDNMLSPGTVLGTARDGRQSAKPLAERLDRTRERNRKAQRRYREKQREECDKLEQQIQDLKTRKANAQAVRSELNAQRHALLDRIVSTSHHPSPQTSAEPDGVNPASTSLRAASAQPQAPAHLLDESARISSLVSACSTSANLYARRPVLPPPASSFRHRAAITYEDLLAASGSTSRIINLSSMSYMDVVQAAQSAAAQRLGCSQADICWYVQSRYEVAPGVPLSYTTCLSTPECVASLVLHSTIAQLEAAVLSATGSATDDSSPRHFTAATLVTQVVPSAARTGDAEPANKRACGEATPTRVPSGGSVRSSDATIGTCTDPLSGAGSGAAAPSATARDVPSVSCGFGGVCDGHKAVRAVMQQFVRGIAQHSTLDASVVADLISRCGDSTAEVVALFDPDEPQERSSAAPCSATLAEAQHEGDDAGCATEGTGVGPATRSHSRHGSGHRTTLSEAWSTSEGMREVPHHAPPPHAPCRQMEGEATGVDMGEFRRQCSLSGDADAHAQGPPPAVQEDSGDCGGTAAAGVSGTTAVGEDDEALLAAYHTTVTAMLCAVLRCASETCYEVSDGWRAGTVQAHAAVEPLPDDAEERRRHEKLYAALTELCTGHVLAMRDGGRVMRGMSANIMSRFLMQYEFENVHVKFYRDLRLTPEQRERMAAWWHSWLRHKCALDATTAAAQQTLNSLPDTLPLPSSHISHICRLAAGTAPPRTCAACAGQGRGSTRDPCEDASGMHGVHACQGVGSECVCAAGGGEAAGATGGPSVCSGCGAFVYDDMHGVLLGADAGSMCRAAEALRLLGRMHDADGALSVRLVAMHQQPGALLDTSRVAWVCRKNMDGSKKALDNMVLCQLAATQLRRQELRRWPAILGQPLPERM